MRHKIFSLFLTAVFSITCFVPTYGMEITDIEQPNGTVEEEVSDSVYEVGKDTEVDTGIDIVSPGSDTEQDVSDGEEILEQEEDKTEGVVEPDKDTEPSDDDEIADQGDGESENNGEDEGVVEEPNQDEEDKAVVEPEVLPEVLPEVEPIIETLIFESTDGLSIVRDSNGGFSNSYFSCSNLTGMPVKLVGLRVEAINGWQFVDSSVDFRNQLEGVKEIRLTFNGQVIESNGFIELENPIDIAEEASIEVPVNLEFGPFRDGFSEGVFKFVAVYEGYRVVLPELPIDPIDPGFSVDPIDPGFSVDPVDPIDPGFSVDPVGPIDPDFSVDPVEPIDPDFSVDPIDPVEPTEPVEETEKTEKIEIVEPVEETEKTEVVEETEAVEITEPIKETESVDLIESDLSEDIYKSDEHNVESCFSQDIV